MICVRTHTNVANMIDKYENISAKKNAQVATATNHKSKWLTLTNGLGFVNVMDSTVSVHKYICVAKTKKRRTN